MKNLWQKYLILVSFYNPHPVIDLVVKNVTEIRDFSRFSNFEISRTFSFFKIEGQIKARSNQHINCHFLKLVTFL